MTFQSKLDLSEHKHRQSKGEYSDYFKLENLFKRSFLSVELKTGLEIPW